MILLKNNLLGMDESSHYKHSKNCWLHCSEDTNISFNGLVIFSEYLYSAIIEVSLIHLLVLHHELMYIFSVVKIH